MVEWKHHGNNYCISTFSDLIYFKGSQASDTENENDGRIKKRRRLSTSMAKPVPKIITPTTITKPATKTATVSTMTKVGKPVVQATTSANCSRCVLHPTTPQPRSAPGSRAGSAAPG